MRIDIRETPFDPLRELANYQDSLPSIHGKYGASAIFIGTMRDRNEGDSVTSMVLEHYPAMTQRHLEHIVEQASCRWNFLDGLLIHRVGHLFPEDPIVLVAIWSEHRAAAFEACRFIMENLKSKAPFWKKESLRDGQRWVSRNTAGFTAASEPSHRD